MCGISAIVSARGGPDTAAIEPMIAAMNHRGPDGNGKFIESIDEASTVSLGHNRLSILDLSNRAAQPMRSRDGRYVLVYNGEVYNYKEIATALDETERPDPGHGDTEVVLAALLKWGVEAFSRFNGMWALILYDSLEKTLLVSRDRFGIKPLHTCHHGTSVLFASEVKAILEATRARFELNADVAIPYLTRGLLNVSDETFFNGIRSFPAASYQLIDLRQPPDAWQAPQRYWWHPVELGEQAEPGRLSPGELREIFVDSVRLQLRSDVPIGVLLSGGVDSSAIVGAVAACQALANVTVFSVTSDDPSASEERFIDLMASHVNLHPRKVNVSGDPLALLQRMDEACWFNDQPVINPSQLAHLQLMTLARSHGVKVLLTGQGADEQLGGYSKFLYFWLQALVRDGAYASASRTLVAFVWRSRMLRDFRPSEAIRYVGYRRLASSTFIAADHQANDKIDIGLRESYARREFIDLMQTSVPALLHYEDRMSMAASVEMRVPYLDHRLVECLARVHPSEKLARGWTKAIFRTAIEGLVPREIQYRQDKRNFAVPTDAWMRGAFAPALRTALASGMMAEQLGLVDASRLRSLYERFVNGRGYLNGRHFFRAYAFEVFLRRFAPFIQLQRA